MSRPVLYDRVAETSTSTGTGNFQLDGAILGYRRFVNTVGVGPTTYYTIEQPGSADFEIGIGALTNSSTLQRVTVLTSSNANALVNFGAGDKNVFMDAPASEFQRLVFNEVPAGAINGSNTVFTLANAPDSATSLLVFLNGILQKIGVGNDFVLVGQTIVFQSGAVPQTGDVLVASYLKG